MSQENVEVVRRFVEAMQLFFESYWENPRSIASAVAADSLWPEYREVLTYTDPEVEWKTAMGQTHRGYLETAKVWDDYLTWAEDYRVDLQELAELDDGRVYAVVALVGKAKAGGTPMHARFFDLFRLRDGRITRIEEYTEREQALEAAGLSE